MKKTIFYAFAAIVACGMLFTSCKDENVAVTSVTVSQPTLTLAPAAKHTLSFEVLPANATNKDVTWKSSAPTVATVANGVVTAVGVGTTTITVTTVDGNKTATCAVTVENETPGYADYIGEYFLTGDIAANGDMWGGATYWSMDHPEPFPGENVLIIDANEANPNLFEVGKKLVVEKVMQYPWPTSGVWMLLDFDTETFELKNAQQTVDGGAAMAVFVYMPTPYNFVLIPPGTLKMQMNSEGEIEFPRTIEVDGVAQTIYFMKATISGGGTSVNPFSEDMICNIKLVPRSE